MLIKDAKVIVDGQTCTKASLEIDAQEVRVDDGFLYVSRAAYKLKYFLEEYLIVPKDKKCLDIGSSTGGFTQILLEKEAHSVTCVDVGKDQLHESLKYNTKIQLHEECNIKEFEQIGFEFVTCDLSFVSTTSLLEEIQRVSTHQIIILFKPQFEVGKQIKRDKKGVVKDMLAITRVQDDFECKAANLGWKCICKDESKVKGKEGNVEFFYYFEK